MCKVRGVQLRLQTNLMNSSEGEGVHPAKQLKGGYSMRLRFTTFVVVYKKICKYSTVNLQLNLNPEPWSTFMNSGRYIRIRLFHIMIFSYYCERSWIQTNLSGCTTSASSLCHTRMVKVCLKFRGYNSNNHSFWSSFRGWMNLLVELLTEQHFDSNDQSVWGGSGLFSVNP